MPQVTIDGQTFPFEPGEKLLQFCLDRGVEIPHFCYHPALSVPANCRQCLVKAGTVALDRETKEPELDEDGQPRVNYFPKMMPSCALDLADGLVVHTQMDDAAVAQAQADNLELMLINHPLDCPICDQAGQCPLQIQAYKYGPEGSRFEFQKVHKPKRVQLGPHVILDAERCINCTRCTRFTEEVTGSHQLTIINRGDKNHPMTAPGMVFDDPYSMCTADICPVGALTEDYFRFKARVWEMSKTPTVSDFGAKGINVDVWVRDNLVLRITPRANPEVNDYWMPDAARLVYNRYNENRPEGPAVGGRLASWAQAYDEAARLLAEAGADVLFVGSAYATVEDNYLLVRLAQSVGAPAPVYLATRQEGLGDGWLVSDDPAPNAAGCERLGLESLSAEDLAARAARARLVYALGGEGLEASALVGLESLSAEDLAARAARARLVYALGGEGLEASALGGATLVLHHTHTDHPALGAAGVALPLTTSVETLGTFVNEDGRAQALRPAKVIRSMNRSLLMAQGVGQSRTDRHGTPFDRWHNDSTKVDCLPGWAALPEIAGRLGHALRYKSPAAVLAEIAAEVPGWAGASPEALGMAGVALQEESAAV